MARSSAAKSATAPTMFFASTSKLRTSPTQPRKRLKSMEDMTASVREKGVLQPILVRTWPGTKEGELEVVAGERRHQAAIAAAVVQVPVILRELTDSEVLEVQVIENNQREDVEPLEEAEAFKAYLDFGHSVPELATKLGRSEGYVRARLRLRDLSPLGRAALERETITFTAAMLLATLNEQQQKKILELEFGVLNDGSLPKWGDNSNITRRDIAQRMEDIACDLLRAGWALDDEELVPDAGACTKCPKRTGSQGELFEEGDRDLCLDEDCFGEKTQIHAGRLLSKAKERGLAILTSNDAKLSADGQSYWNSTVVPLDEEIEVAGDDEDAQPVTTSLRALINEHKLVLPAAVVQTSSGQVIEVVGKADAAKALKSIAPEVAEDWRRNVASSYDASSGRDTYSEQERRRAKKWKVELEGRRRIVGALVDAIAKQGLDDDAVRALVLIETETGWSDALSAIIKRRGWVEAKAKAGKDGSYTGKREETVIRESRELEGGALLGLLVELSVSQSLSRKGQHGGDVFGAKDPLGTLVANYSINVAHHRAEAKKALEPKAKVKKAPTAKAKPSKKKAAKKAKAKK